MSPQIPSVALTGFANASFYDLHRPSYPLSAVSVLLAHLRVSGVRNAKILDLAAGTGKFTELLAKRDENFKIAAVEPHEGMRKELDRKGLNGVKVMDGNATGMPMGKGEVDAAVVAQDYYIEMRVYKKDSGVNCQILIRSRFANNEALKEIYRVLASGGVLGMIWNIEDYNAPKSWAPTTQWESKIKAITWSFDDDHPRFRHEHWKQVFENQLQSTPFNIFSADPQFSLPLGEDSVEFTYWLSPEAVWERYHSLSQIAVLEGDALTKVKTEVFEAMSDPDVEKNEKGEVALHGRTVLYWTSSVPGAPLKEGG